MHTETVPAQIDIDSDSDESDEEDEKSEGHYSEDDTTTDEDSDVDLEDDEDDLSPEQPEEYLVCWVSVICVSNLWYAQVQKKCWNSLLMQMSIVTEFQ